MLRRRGFQTEKIIGFRYVKKEGRTGIEWHLLECTCDAKTKKKLGPGAFEPPSVMTIPPWSLLSPLHRALTEHQLDGGIFNELPSTGDDYGFTIAIKRRTMKPNQ